MPQSAIAPEHLIPYFKHLIEQLEQDKSETLTTYLTAMARFHSYSCNPYPPRFGFLAIE